MPRFVCCTVDMFQTYKFKQIILVDGEQNLIRVRHKKSTFVSVENNLKDQSHSPLQ